MLEMTEKNKLSTLQMELLKSLKYMANEKQLQEVRSLLRFYFAHQLDKAIDEVENARAYSAAIYEKWLKENTVSKKNK